MSGHVGSVVDKVTLGKRFSEYFGNSFHRLLCICHHLSIGTGKISQLVTDVPRRLKSPHRKKLKKKYILIFLGRLNRKWVRRVDVKPYEGNKLIVGKQLITPYGLWRYTAVFSGTHIRWQLEPVESGSDSVSLISFVILKISVLYGIWCWVLE
jgi:hypothetical protein